LVEGYYFCVGVSFAGVGVILGGVLVEWGDDWWKMGDEPGQY